MNEQTPLDEQVVSPRPKPSYTGQIRSILLGIISVVLVLVAAGFAYMYTQKSRELAALQAVDAPVGVAEPAEAPAVAGEGTSKAGTPVVMNYASQTQILYIKEWGISVNLPAFGTGQYSYEDTSRPEGAKGVEGMNAIAFKHSDFGKKCTLGVLIKRPSGTLSGADRGPGADYIASSGGFEYGFQGPQSACSPGETAQDRVVGAADILRGAIVNMRISSGASR